ncbi:hypothetical protein JBL43_07000 [Aureibaculum sp. A20]|uniref:Lipoprotein n=1 Tax=Aureibaculum flavum TaxID=2795986 RepID=A0ABS0WPT9_9FLAO|nr:hypothetical protein [Aureibaculum flavum]MBJ2173978.1 hypothetical protein [Aureibaculum flavum]
MKNLKKINKLLLITGILTLGFLISSCDPTDVLKLDNNCENNWTTEVQDELTAYGNAISAYSTDPTPENCNDLKKAGNNYIDALKDVEKCVPTLNQADWKKALEESKAQINETSCE